MTDFDVRQGGVFGVSALEGLVTPSSGELVTGVTGSQPVARQQLVNGALVDVTAFEVNGDAGGTFTIFPDGSWLFEAGNDFDTLTSGQSAESAITVTLSDGTTPREVVLTATVQSDAADPTADFAPRLDDDFTDTDLADLGSERVEGSFRQIGGVDVVSELFGRLDDQVAFDLDSLLDLTLVDIDTRFSLAYDPVRGVQINVEDKSTNEDALLGAIAPLVQPVADLAEDGFDAANALQLSPVAWGPAFNVEFGFAAQLGWDIDLPSLGKTSITQPVAMQLYLPDGHVAPGESFTVVSGGYQSLSPTTTVQTVGLGDIKLDAGFELTQAKLSDLGFAIGTRDVLGFELAGLAEARFGLNADFDLVPPLEEITGAESSTVLSLSFSNLLAGLVALDIDLGEKISAIKDAVKNLDQNKLQGLLADLFSTLQDALTLAAGENLPTYDMFGVEVSSVELVELVDRVAFNEFDGFDNGAGYFEFSGDPDPIRITAGQVDVTAAITGVSSVVSDLAEIFGPDGFTPFEGLTLNATLPFGNVEQIEGFGTDGAGNVITETQDGPAAVEITQTTRLASLELDFDKLAPALTGFAIDQVTSIALEAVRSQSYLIPVVAGASIAARASLALGEQVQDTVESGFTASVALKPTQLVAQAINPLIEILNTATGAVATATGTEVASIDALTAEDIEATIDGSVDAVVAKIAEALGFIANAGADVLEILADNPAARAVTDAINGFVSLASSIVGSVSDTVNALRNPLTEAILGPVFDIVDLVLAVPQAGIDAVGDVSGLLQSLVDAAREFTLNLGSDLSALASDLGGVLKDLAAGVELALTSEFNLFEFLIDAGIDIIQTVRFDPDEVSVTYHIDGREIEATQDQAVEFFATGQIGDVLDGQATYRFSGDVDYDYRLQLNIDPELTIWGTSVSGEFGLGNSDPEDFSFDYAALKLTDDVNIETVQAILGGDLAQLGQLFDDALVEVPLGLFEEVAEQAVDGLRTSLGEIAGQDTDLAWNEFRLFTLDDVEITEEDFLPLIHEFQIAIGEEGQAARGDRNLDIRFRADEDAPGLAITDGNLFDQSVSGTIVRVNGSAGNVDTVQTLNNGARFALGRDGTVALDTQGAFESLGAGETAEEQFTASIQTTSGLVRSFTAVIEITGANDAPEAVADSVTVAEDGTVTFDPSANDTDVDTSDELSVTAVAVDNPDHGTATVGTDGRVTFTPTADFDGTVNITYTVADTAGATTEGAVLVTVTPDDVDEDRRLFGENETATGNLLDELSAPGGSEVTDVVDATLTDGVFVRVLEDGTVVAVLPDGNYIVTGPDTQDALAQGTSRELDIEVTYAEGNGGPGVSALLKLAFVGENDAPETTSAQFGNVSANSDLAVDAAEGVLTLASDPDDGARLSLDLPSSGKIDGDSGGTFRIAADGSFVFDPGSDFSDLELGQSRESSAIVLVQDEFGSQAGAEITVTVDGIDSGPIKSDDARFALIDASAFNSLQSTVVAGSFDQRGGVDVTQELFSRLDDATGFDINDLLDFTLIDINKRFNLSSDIDNGLSFDIENVEEPNGALAKFDSVVSEGLTTAVNAGGMFVPLDLGPVEIAPRFDATIGLDLEFGWDIDIPTLGKTAVFQPFELNLETPDAAQVGDYFVLGSDNFVSLSPTSVTETVGVGAFQLNAGLQFPETEISNFGFGIASSDFAGLELDGLAQGQVSLNQSITLDDAAETTRSLIIDAVGTIVSAIPGGKLPFDLEKVLTTILALDVGNLLSGLFSSELDIQPLLDAFQEETAEAKLNGVLDFIATLSELGPNTNASVPVEGALLTETEVFTTTNRIAFNDFDDWDANGVGFFNLDDGDGGTVEVRAQPLLDAREFLGIDANVDAFARAFSELGFSPTEEATIRFAAPIGNVETFEGFGTDADGNALTEAREGTSQIEVVQETRLVDVDVDLYNLGPALVRKVLDLVSEVDPALAKLAASQGSADELTRVLEEGFNLNLKLEPVELVVATANGFVDLFNTVSGALAALVDSDPALIDRIELTDSLETTDQAIDLALSKLTDGFGLIAPLLEGPAAVLKGILDAASLDDVANAIEGISFTSLVETAENALDDIANITITVPDLTQFLKFKEIPLIPAALLDPVRSVLETAKNIANGIDSGADAVAELITDFNDKVEDLLNFDLESAFDDLLGQVAGVLKDAARGGELDLNAGFSLFDVGISAGVDLVQIAKFDPDDVTVSYDLDGIGIDSAVGDQVAFFAGGNVGDVLEGEATYGFSGNVDYEYRLRLDVDPTFNVFGVDVSGEFSLGENISFAFDDDFSLAALSETHPLAGGDLASAFDEALFELNFDFLGEIAADIQDQLANAINLPVGDVLDIEAGELSLFKLDDVQLDAERFNTVSQDFSVTLVDGFVPEARDLELATDEDTPLSGQLDGSDRDGTASQLTYTLAGGNGPTNGKVEISTDGRFTYTPGANFNGSDSFGYVVRDGDGNAAPMASVSIDVASVNDLPRVSPASIIVQTSDVSVEATGVLVGEDADNDTLAFSLDEQAAKGTARVSADGRFTYTPDAGSDGFDSFRVAVNDGTTTVRTTVTTSPNTAPVIGDADLEVLENGAITFTPDVMDPEGDVVSVAIGDRFTARHGTVAALAAGSFVYTPDPGFFGTDTFDITATDGFLSDSGLYTVTVTPEPVEEEDAVLGTAGDDEVFGTGSDDFIVAGLGKDRIETGEGSDRIAGDLIELDGDTLVDFSQMDILVFQNVLLDPDQVTFNPETATIEVIADPAQNAEPVEIKVEADLPEGGLLVYASGTETKAAYVNVLPELSEFASVDAADVNGIVNQDFLTNEGSTNFTLTISAAAGAAFNNSVGLYEIREDGSIEDVRVLATNAKDGGTFEITDVDADSSIGFFIVQNGEDAVSGASQFIFENAAGGSANVNAPDDIFFTGDGAAINANIFHSYAADLNPDGIEHVLSGLSSDGTGLAIGFEDILFGGDRDYQDVLFTIERDADLLT